VGIKVGGVATKVGTIKQDYTDAPAKIRDVYLNDFQEMTKHTRIKE
jgi:hypothetical protein